MPKLIQQLEQRKKSLDSFFSSKKLIQRVKDSGRSKVKIKNEILYTSYGGFYESWKTRQKWTCVV